MRKLSVQTGTMRMFDTSEAETNYFFSKINNVALQYFQKVEDYSFPVKRRKEGDLTWEDRRRVNGKFLVTQHLFRFHH